jgi:2-dehydropantoate 2-reductase
VLHGVRQKLARVRATADTQSVLLAAAFELVIVAVKATATQQAIDSIAALKSASGASILSPQNGVGNEELLAGAFGADRIVAGALTTPVERVGENGIRAAPKGGLTLAPVGASAHNWVIAAFAGSGMRLRAAADWRSLKWSKLCMNLMANALCAALDWTPAQVYADRAAFALERRCLSEAQEVMRRLKIRAMSLIDCPVPWLLWLNATLPSAVLQPLLAAPVRGARGGKLPSLLLDLRAGRCELEIGALNGAVAAHAQSAGIAAPANALLNRVVGGIARGDLDWSLYRGKPEALEAAMQAA